MMKSTAPRLAASFRAAWHGAIALAEATPGGADGSAKYVGTRHEGADDRPPAQAPLTPTLSRGAGGKDRSSTNMASARTRPRYLSAPRMRRDSIEQEAAPRAPPVPSGDQRLSRQARRVRDIDRASHRLGESGRAPTPARRALPKHQTAPARHDSHRRKRLVDGRDRLRPRQDRAAARNHRRTPGERRAAPSGVGRERRVQTAPSPRGRGSG